VTSKRRRQENLIVAKEKKSANLGSTSMGMGCAGALPGRRTGKKNPQILSDVGDSRTSQKNGSSVFEKGGGGRKNRRWRWRETQASRGRGHIKVEEGGGKVGKGRTGSKTSVAHLISSRCA